MAKRLSSNQSNTLFNYFQSPSSKKPNTSKPKEDVKIERKDQDSDEEIVTTKKKRNRIIIADSDSDSDIENESPKQVAKKAKKSKPEVETEPKADSMKIFSFGATNAERENVEPKSAKETKKDLMASVGVKWLHETLPFLQPNKIKDAQKRRPDHSDYDAKTVYVPDDFLAGLTPAMRQWWELKRNHFDTVLFFKVGKFYELYHMDATVGVEYLGFSYMKGEFAHSGFPETAFGKMASMLIEQGFKVARVEQTETPEMMAERCKTIRPTKFDKVVKREICQVISKGTCLYGAQITDAKQPYNNYMISITEKVIDNVKHFGVCFIDTSIGIFYLSEFDDDQMCSRLLSLIAQHPCSLCLMERGHVTNETKSTLKVVLSNVKTEMLAPDSQFYSASTVLQKLRAGCYFKNEDDEFAWPESFKQFIDDREAKPEYELALHAFGGCCWYLANSKIDIQIISMKKFEIYEPIDIAKKNKTITRDYMILDSVTLHNLKLLGGLGTLQKTIDYCVTPFGKRLLQQWICRPLCDINKIKQRQDAVTELYNNNDLLKSVRRLLSKLPDLEREIAKIHGFGNRFISQDHPDGRAIFYEAKTYNKRKIMDLLSTLDAFEAVQDIPTMFQECESKFLRKLSQHPPVGGFEDLSETLRFFKNAFDHKKAKEDGIIIPQRGVDRDYDESVENIKLIEKELDEYLAEQTKFFKCNVVYFGNDKKRFQLEIPDSKCHKVPDDYLLEGARKGSKPVKRYSTSTTRELLAAMLKAEAERNSILQDLNRRIFEKFSSKANEWLTNLNVLTILDCICALAEYATFYTEDLCMPTVLPFSDEITCKIVNGRHPCVLNVDEYVPNDLTLGDKNHAQIMVLTGPNMGGKSTLMRQTILICILAQLGSFVPASSCEVSVIDRIFTRMGAHDDILKNQSTFLVELAEASIILQHVTKHSFVLLDELGRGTSTHDGNAIATAYVKKLCQINCRTIFSTHYHSLVEHFHGRSEILLGYMGCKVENEGDIAKEEVTFLYKLAEGLCPKSYGFNVAKLAGLTPTLVNRAKDVATKFESIAVNRKFFKKLGGRDDDPFDLRKLLLSLNV